MWISPVWPRKGVSRSHPVDERGGQLVATEGGELAARLVLQAVLRLRRFHALPDGLRTTHNCAVRAHHPIVPRGAPCLPRGAPCSVPTPGRPPSSRFPSWCWRDAEMEHAEMENAEMEDADTEMGPRRDRDGPAERAPSPSSRSRREECIPRRGGRLEGGVPSAGTIQGRPLTCAVCLAA